MKFSLQKYGWRCVLGIEAFYLLCLTYGTFLNGAVAGLHHALFGLLPGFAWGSVFGLFAGAVDLFVFAWVFAAYMVWMLNSSLVERKQ